MQPAYETLVRIPAMGSEQINKNAQTFKLLKQADPNVSLIRSGRGPAMYTKSIVLIEDRRLEQFTKQLLQRKKKAVETTIPLLTKVSAIKEDIQKNKNTVNLRGEFGHFVKENGLPFLMIMDYHVDFGLSLQEDPDKRKLVRTFLLAFTLLANAKGHGDASANIVFVVDKNMASTISQFSKYPSFLLEQIRTMDDRVNSIIDSFAADRNKVKSFFKITYIFNPEEGKYAPEIERLDNIVDTFDKIVAAKLKAIKTKTTTEMITDTLKPAEVICRATLEKIIRNGKLDQVREEAKKRYIEKNIHLEGAITTKTLPEVTKRLLATFQAMSKVNPFKKDEKIFINIPDSSVIDGSFASVMGAFLTKSLAGFKGISLNMGKTNSEKVKNSEGYIAIKDYIIKNL